MKVGDLCRVLVDKGRGHPKGTEVVIVLIKNDYIYCRAKEGMTEYLYSSDQLELIESEEHA